MSEFKVPDSFTPPNRQKLEDLADLLNKFWGYLIFIVVLTIVFSGTVVKVDAGERAVIFNVFGGVEKRILGEGIHVIIPFVQRATIYDVKQATYSFTSEEKGQQGLVVGDEIHSLTSDGQKVDIELSVRAKPQPSEVWRLHQSIGPSYASKVIFPVARTVLREILAM